MFKEAMLYTVNSGWPKHGLSEALEARAFTPCGEYREESFGFVPIPHTKALSYTVMGVDYALLRIQCRKLQPKAIEEALNERVSKYKSRMNAEPNGAEKRDMKEEVIAVLLPTTPLQSDYVWVAYIHKTNQLILETASEQRADKVLGALKAALMIAYHDVKPVWMQKLLTDCLLHNQPFKKRYDCVISDGAAKISYVDAEPLEEATNLVRGHNFKIKSIALSGDDCTFTLNADCVITKVKPIAVIEAFSVPDDGSHNEFSTLQGKLILAVENIATITDAISKAAP